MQLLECIAKKSTTKNISIGLLIILLINSIVFPYFSSEQVHINSILDLRFGFSAADVSATLAAMKGSGRKAYLLSTLLIDTPYAMFYGFIYAFIIYRLSKNTFLEKIPILILIPFLISIFDLIENTGILFFILKFPDNNAKLVYLFSFANQLKWTFALLTLLLFLILLVTRLLNISASNTH